jgi:hypothetical protein
MSQSSGVPVPAVRRIVEGATHAPSVHNTQPWLWRDTPRGLELRADPSRRLPATDPVGRNMVLSCGAALHHAQVVAAATGWSPVVTRHPDPAQPDLLARIALSPAPPAADGLDVLAAVERRCTDRRRFTSWPVPDERLQHLAEIAGAWGTNALALTDATSRYRAERSVMSANDAQSERGAVVAERDSWLQRQTPDGIPAATLQATGVAAGAFPHRFHGAGDATFEGTPDTDLDDQTLQLADGLVVLFDSDDDPACWLRAGEGLSAMWLAATSGGLSLVPLSQAVEVDDTRAALRRDVLHGLGHPLLLARIGWQAIGRSALVRTPRRPVDEVLEVV